MIQRFRVSFGTLNSLSPCIPMRYTVYSSTGQLARESSKPPTSLACKVHSPSTEPRYTMKITSPRHHQRFDDLFREHPLSDPPIPPSRRPPGRLGLDADDAVRLFRTAYEAFNTGRLSDATEPVRQLRLFGVAIKFTPSAGPRPAAK